ncbi:MAG: hypothetical protein M1837_001110 [Sclerophora amabilis]|nr:MAG: hypothetical protein M1837_001110 [Sclerophora amabilis]
MAAAPPDRYEEPIEANPDFSKGADLIPDDDMSRYYSSITSSVVDYPYEHGRRWVESTVSLRKLADKLMDTSTDRYHAFKDGVYQMPNDDQEMDRLDLAHGMFRLILRNRLYLAPIGADTRRILDIGTGTGIWAIEMGDEIPDAEIIGTDLSPIQPNLYVHTLTPYTPQKINLNRVPPNVKFEIDDCEESWIFRAKFDFIHSRCMAAAISNWPKLMSQTFEHITPGGWAEFHDLNLQYYSEDGSFTEDLPLYQWIHDLLAGYERLGIETCPGPKLERWLKDAGFQNVVQHKYKVPIGPWARNKDLVSMFLSLFCSKG